MLLQYGYSSLFILVPLFSKTESESRKTRLEKTSCNISLPPFATSRLTWVSTFFL